MNWTIYQHSSSLQNTPYRFFKFDTHKLRNYLVQVLLVEFSPYLLSDYTSLPKLEIPKFNGDPTKWQSFFDSFQAAVGKSTNLTDVEKFNYLRRFLEGDALHAVAGFSLTNDNYEESLELLQNRHGNTQQIIAAHMNALVKMSSFDNEDLSGLRKFFDGVTSHMRSLVNLGAEGRTYGSLVCPIILEKLPNELRLIISRNNSKNGWNFTKILDLINVESKTHEACVVSSHTAVEGRNDFAFNSPSHTPYTGSSLVSGSLSVHREKWKEMCFL